MKHRKKGKTPETELIKEKGAETNPAPEKTETEPSADASAETAASGAGPIVIAAEEPSEPSAESDAAADAKTDAKADTEPAAGPAAAVPAVSDDAADAASDDAAAKKPGKGMAFLYDLANVLITAAIIITIFFTFFYRFSGVIGESMEPTLYTGDWLVLSQMTDSKPSYGDIVVISQPNAFNENIVKRVIATEGQTIDINFKTGDVIVDGKILDEPYINNATTDSFDTHFPLVVPEGYCFVMGDNRQNSIDSRSSKVGLIRDDYILGIAQYAQTSSGGKNLRLSAVNS